MEQLLEFCYTDRQRTVIEAIVEQGSQSKAAKYLGINKRNVEYIVSRVRKNAVRRGLSPEHSMTRTVPDGFIAKGVSTLYNADGKVSAQWVKATLDDTKWRDMLQAMAEAFCDDIKPVCAEPSPKTTNSDLVNTYVITDYHIGMKAWGEECGEDWDLKIAEETLIKWFAAAIKQSPDAEVGVLAQVGDFLHFDGLEAITPTAKHVLDADTRFQLVVRVAIRTLRAVIAMLLHKHKRVHLIIAEGNHDIASSVWLREMLCALYSEEPRVTVDKSPDIYYCFEWGKTSLFFHHGHKTKFESLDNVFAAKFRHIFGKTKHSYAHLGHYHHARVKESNLMVIEQHRTLAASDAHSSRGGYMSGRDAKVITYHKEYGEVARVSISSEMIRHCVDTK